MNAGCAGKLWDPLRTRAIPERLRGAFTTRRYTNPRLPLPLPDINYSINSAGLNYIHIFTVANPLIPLAAEIKSHTTITCNELLQPTLEIHNSSEICRLTRRLRTATVSAVIG